MVGASVDENRGVEGMAYNLFSVDKGVCHRALLDMVYKVVLDRQVALNVRVLREVWVPSGVLERALVPWLYVQKGIYILAFGDLEVYIRLLYEKVDEVYMLAGPLEEHGEEH